MFKKIILQTHLKDAVYALAHTDYSNNRWYYTLENILQKKVTNIDIELLIKQLTPPDENQGHQEPLQLETINSIIFDLINEEEDEISGFESGMEALDNLGES